MAAPLDELLIERHAFSTQRTLFGIVSWKIATHETEDRLAVDLDRRAPPEAPHADHLRAEMLHQLDQEIQLGAARDQVLPQQQARAGPQRALELDGQRPPPLAARQALGAVDDD